MRKPDKEAYRKRNEDFLALMAQEEGVGALRGGVLYKVLASGNGLGTVTPRSKVTCHYRGSLVNGKVFDDSYSRRRPETFRVNELISGFQIALVNMHIGDHWLVYIPSGMGYGPEGAGRDIPGNSTLIFEIELLNIG